MSCAGSTGQDSCGSQYATDCNGAPAVLGCPSTCSVNSPSSGTSNVNATCSLTTNPVSGTSYVAGSYSNGYRKWVKNVASTETNSSTATKGTTLTYSNTTTGNNGMTTSIQAVLPTSSSARINDSVPTNSGNQTVTATAHTALTGVSVTGTWYQGYSSTSCAATQVNPLASIAANAGTCVTPTKTYVRYTLQSYNDSTMGYRPVIVVKKAN
jgi:hypothetical protein